MRTAPADHDQTHDLNVGRILNEFLDAKRRGQSISETELLTQHPELAGDLREHLDLLRGLDPADATVEDLVTRDILAPSSDPRYLAELGSYGITGFLGRGGMGIVLTAYEESLNRTVALKLLRPDLAHDATALQRFTREAKAAAALRNQNIVTVYAVGRHRDTHYIAMEYVEGLTLADFMREHAPLRTETIRGIFGQLLNGLRAAHDANLIHRDIKPSNILLDRIDGCPIPSRDGGMTNATGSDVPVNTVIKIADFGLARIASSQTRMTAPDSVLGTPEYMSPEQARGDEFIDHRTDLYSAGVVLFEMLTGRTPFSAPTPSAVIHKILHEDPPAPKSFAASADPHLASLALRLMAKRPDDRFASALRTMEVLSAGKRISSPEKRRGRIWAAMLGVLAAVFLTTSLWRAPNPWPGPTVIVEAFVEDSLPRVIQARRGDDMEPTRFYEFPAASKVVLNDAVVGDAGVDGSQVVVACAQSPLDDENNVVIALNANGEELWRTPLHTDLQWPDCDPPRKWWSVNTVDCWELDGDPGCELVLVANDWHEYPTRISMLSTATGDVEQSFWHFGQISGIDLQPAYFDDDRPAIIARGVSNKLGGFEKTQEGDAEPVAQRHIVSVVMILDPRNMKGLGPPRSKRLPELAEARPQAYAFLDLDPSPKSSTETEQDLVVTIYEVRMSKRRPHDDTGPWFELGIKSKYPTPGGNATLPGFPIVDRDLRLRGVAGALSLVGSEEAAIKAWKKYWRPIIQNGVYVKR